MKRTHTEAASNQVSESMLSMQEKMDLRRRKGRVFFWYRFKNHSPQILYFGPALTKLKPFVKMH